MASGTNQFFRPTTAGFGVLTGTFGVCVGGGAWCQGPGDSAPGQTLRLAGNWKSDAGNPWSSDLNADGISELLISNWDDGITKTFSGGWVYWGQGTPASPSWSAAHSTTLPTIGAHGVLAADLNGDGLPETIFTNYQSGYDANMQFNLNSYVYWGQPGGAYSVTYSSAARTELPTSGSSAVSVADLNRDGRPEIIVANYTNGITVNIDSYIYWGQAGGTYGVTYSSAARTDLPTSGGMAALVADLNSDGWSEVVFLNFSESTEERNLYVYWGQPGGAYGVIYTTTARAELPTIGARGGAIADLNSDQRPEIIVSNNHTNTAYIYWGQAGGTFGTFYSPITRTHLPVSTGLHKLSVGDVNNDGTADIVAQSRFNTFTRIFTGPFPVGGAVALSWTLPLTTGFRGLSLTDLNNDGRLDILISRQAGDTGGFIGGRSTRVYLHTGNNAAPYNTTPSFDLPALSSPGAYASFGPGRGTNGDWFSQPRPVYGTAFPTFGVLESMVIDSGQNGSGWTQAQASAQISAGTGITLFVAASDSLSALNNPTWVQAGAMSNGTWTQGISGVMGRYARYRVVLWRNRTTEASPALHSITFTYATQPGAFSKTAPMNGATGQPTNPTLSWGAASGADHYRYCYSTSLGCVPATSNGMATSVMLSGLTPGTTYYWQARACGDPGCTVFTDANSGAYWSFTIVNPPGAFSKSAPANGATGLPTNPTLSWGASSGVVNYEYCLSMSPLCLPGSWVNVGTATSAAVSGLTTGATYYWQARACNAAGCTYANAGAFWSFQTAAAVGSFQKLTPGDGAININPGTDQLQWSAAPGATEYKVCVGKAVNACDVLGGGPGQYASVGGSQSRTLSDLSLQPNTVYYWQALATNGTYTTFADGGALAFWKFVTLPSAPAAFNKVSPAFNATNVPTQNVGFVWQPATGAVSYTVCVGAFAGDCSLSATSTGTSTVLAGPLPAGATLVWQVTAHNAGGSAGADNGAWWPFTVVPNAPLSFSKLNPADGATDQGLGVALSWQDTAGETQYQVCAGTSIGLCNLLSGTVAANTTFTTLTGLNYGTQYWWQVSACNAGGCTPANNGVSWGFKTLNPPAPGPFQKTTPFNGATGLPADATQVLLQWSAANLANGYEVCFGTQPGTCDLSGGGFQDVGNVTSRLVSQLPFSVTLQPASTYWWQVRAYNTLTATRSFADGGVDFFFTTASVSGPGSFSKDAPVNNTFNVPTASVTLRWFAAAGAQSYEVCAGSAANVCNALPGNAWLNVGSGLSYTLTNLQPGTTYWWQVRALNGSGQTQANGGVWWTFNTRNAEPPAEFSKAAPAHTAISVPTATAVLSWYVSTGATGYEVCLGSAPGLCNASGGWVNVGSATSWTPALQAGQTYWWQVRALGSSFSVQANGGQWWAFTTLNDVIGPLNFQKVSPANAAITSSTVTLTWTGSAGDGMLTYRVCVGTGWGLCDVVNSVNVGTATSHVLSGLLPGSYWWQITAVDENGNTTQADGGARWVFTVADDGVGNLNNAGTRKQSAPAAVRMGERVTYTIVLSNSGAVAVTARVTDTLAVSATLLSATPGYAQSGQTLSWSNVVVPANGTATITITVRAGSGPLPGGYTLNNSVTIGARDGTITRNDMPGVQVGPWQAYAPIVLTP